MAKKLLPYIAFVLAALLLWFIKTHQRGSVHSNVSVQQDHSVVPHNRTEDNTSTDNKLSNEEGFNRHASNILYSKHAKCRMECRHIDEREVKEILDKGTINYNKIESDSRGKTYPLEGVTHDHQHVRIVFAPKGNDAVEVVTCIDLDTDWPCQCY